jgi:hypothetical protein
MPTVNDFRTVQVQASLFTPGLQFRSAKVLGHLLTEYSDKFDGEPQTLPPIDKFAPSGLPSGLLVSQFFPQIMLQSADGHLRLQAGASRLDVIREGDAITEEETSAQLAWACELGLRYLELNDAKAGRVACIISRLGDASDPGKALAKHFCKPQWIDGPLNRPSSFEMHAHKRFRLDDLFEVNSWVRVKTAVRKEENAVPFPPNVILVEQDVNSLTELMESRELSEHDLRRFFELSPREMCHVLEMYFPPELS